MNRVRGKKGGKILEATMDSACKKHFKDIKETKFLLLISIKGNEYCLNDYLQLMIEKAIKDYGSVSVLIADEVYRHNLRTLSGNDDEDYLRAEALKLGDKFFLENIPYILQALSISQDRFDLACSILDINAQIEWINNYAQAESIDFELVRWQEWLTRDNYLTEFSSEIESLYESVDFLRENLLTTSEDFARRHQSEGEKELWLHRSKAYLKEESPAVMWCSISRGYEFIAYPGSIIAPMEATKKFFLQSSIPRNAQKFQQNIDPNLIGHWLDVHFKKSHGHTVTNLNPKAHELALERVGFFKKAVDHHEDINSIVVTVTLKVFADEKIPTNLKIQALISLLGELAESEEYNNSIKI